MSKETTEEKANQAEKAEKQGRIVQVLAAALAAVTAALLGSTLGVAGTVVGAGLASVITTVCGELYLRSLQRTRDAALKAREVLTAQGRRRAVNPDDQETVRLKPLDGERPERKWKPRWLVIAGISVAAFAVAILAITGFESVTGKAVGGGTGTTIGKIVGGGGQAHEKKRETPPVVPTEAPQAPPETTSSEAPPASPMPTAPPATPSAPATTPSAPTQTPSATPAPSAAPVPSAALTPALTPTPVPAPAP